MHGSSSLKFSIESPSLTRSLASRGILYGQFPNKPVDKEMEKHLTTTDETIFSWKLELYYW